MIYEFDIPAFQAMLKHVQGGRSLRALTESIAEKYGDKGVSISTLGRILNGGEMPSFDSYCILCSYAGRHPGEFFCPYSLLAKMSEMEQRISDLEGDRDGKR